MAKDDSSNGDKLLSFFDSDSQVAGEKLLRIRQKLIRYFSAERCPDPQELSDETLFRVIKAINEGKQVTTTIEAYIFGFAKNILREARRLPQFDSLEELPPDKERATSPEQETLAPWERQEILAYYQKCLMEFTDSEQKLFLGYYAQNPGEKPKEARERLASLMGLSRAVLKQRAFRIRERLEACIKNCMSMKGTKSANPHK
jgi:DNA-directed RNA polymerase specialized sigma24 family protein